MTLKSREAFEKAVELASSMNHQEIGADDKEIVFK
jgi:hypothetical protein